MSKKTIPTPENPRMSARKLKQAIGSAAGKRRMMIPAAIRFAIRWAIIAERMVCGGAKVEDILEMAREQADTDRLFGTLHEYAVYFLTNTWDFGEQLQEWSGLQFGYIPLRDRTKKYDNLLLDTGVPI